MVVEILVVMNDIDMHQILMSSLMVVVFIVEIKAKEEIIQSMITNGSPE